MSLCSSHLTSLKSKITQKLYFFRWQTKPRMTIHGDLYYEGKEFETKLKEKKPGDLSDELRTALGMPVGPSAHKVIFFPTI